MKRFFFCILLILASKINAKAQAVWNTGMERDMHSDRYVRLNYQNDFFTATDYYLTQGVILEFVHPDLKPFFLNKIMLRLSGAEMKYGLAFEQNGYTPTDYVSAQILYGDRPFAGTLSFKNFTIATDVIHKQRLSSGINIGVLGPLAGAGDIQTYIHERTPNALPYGWHNQIANDLVLNYRIHYEKQLMSLSNYLNVAATGTVHAGTTFNRAAVGLTIMAGIFNDPFTAVQSKRKRFQVYLYDHPEINAVAYDATLQGGLFNKNSPYTIDASNVSRFVFRNDYGIVVRLGKVYLEYYYTFMTKEFRTGLEMKNGGINIGCSF